MDKGARGGLQKNRAFFSGDASSQGVWRVS